MLYKHSRQETRQQTPDPLSAGAVEIQLDQKLPPVSNYIYGQFIEHLGRCINGGILAEMVEDRKFKFPVSNNYRPYGDHANEQFPILVASPWKIIGGAAVLDVPTDFREDDVLQVQPGKSGLGGVEQDRLALESGRSYVGRIVTEGDVEVTIGNFHKRFAGSSNAFETHYFGFASTSDNQNGTFRVVGKAQFRIAATSLMPSDNVFGFRRDVINDLKSLNGTIYRWPGGNFASGYFWKDGIGDPDKRPTRPNPAWTGIEPNDMGINEFMKFCNIIHAEPLVVVNTGFGDPETAAEFVEYCNGADTTPMGMLRKKLGHPLPFGVKWWGIGNEMWGNWQLGHMDEGQYVTKHNLTFDKMKKVDPNILTVGSGDIGGNWDKILLEGCMKNMTVLSEHLYCGEKKDPVEHALQIPEAIHEKVVAFEKYKATIPGFSDSGIKIDLDEWNYWYGPDLYGENGNAYSVKDGLGIALGLQEIIRHGDVFGIAQYAQTVNVLGCIKATKTASWLETTGLVLEMYRDHFGNNPVNVSTITLPKGVDIVAAYTRDGNSFTVGIVNSGTTPVDVSMEGIDKIPHLNEAQGWHIVGTDPLELNDEKNPNRVEIKQFQPEFHNNIITIPALSSSIIRVLIK